MFDSATRPAQYSGYVSDAACSTLSTPAKRPRTSWVHVVMYFYYLCSSLLGKDSRKKYLWWGKYLTQMQMLQFSLNLFQASYNLLSDSAYPRFLNELLFVYMISLLGLFGHFYVQRWVVKSPPKSKRA